MLNFIKRTEPRVNLLFGRRPLQRVTVGSSKQVVEIPLGVIEPIYEKIDNDTLYCMGTHSPMEWSEFAKIKVDAANIIEADVKSALTDLDFYPALTSLYVGQVVMSEMNIISRLAPKQIKYPLANS
eukprot:GHVL01030574.1.p1 GENE.GHVL01030574.1~~GHVL01030574.1.p1  ORF type:complete len:126 (+),score=14.53 GHVL01030574.1:26-403(+)